MIKRTIHTISVVLDFEELGSLIAGLAFEDKLIEKVVLLPDTIIIYSCEVI